MDPSLVHGYSFHGSEKTTREKEVIQFDFINSHVSKLKAVMAIISLSFFAFVVHNFSSPNFGIHSQILVMGLVGEL